MDGRIGLDWGIIERGKRGGRMGIGEFASFLVLLYSYICIFSN